MTAASEARRIALMLNDSKWQEIEEEIRKAIERAEAGHPFEIAHVCFDGHPRRGFVGECGYCQLPPCAVPTYWRDQPDGVR